MSPSRSISTWRCPSTCTNRGRCVARAWELRRNLTTYDAAYVALAEALEAPLLTLDRALGRAVVAQTDVPVLGMS